MGLGKFFGTHLGYLGQGQLPKQDAIYLVPMMKWEPLIQ